MGILADLIALVNGNTEKTLDVLIQEKATETNSKIESKASQTSVDAVKNLVQDGNNLVGANNNTGGSIGVGSISARINKLLTDWTTTRAGYLDTINTNVGTLLNGRVLKSVQRGVVSSNAFNYSTATVNHNIVSLNKSILIITTPLSRSGGVVSVWVANRIPISSQSEAFTLQISQSPDGGTAVSWELVEFY